MRTFNLEVTASHAATAMSSVFPLLQHRQIPALAIGEGSDHSGRPLFQIQSIFSDRESHLLSMCLTPSSPQTWLVPAWLFENIVSILEFRPSAFAR